MVSFQLACLQSQLTLHHPEVVQTYDSNGSGSLEWDEFVMMIFEATEPKFRVRVRVRIRFRVRVRSRVRVT